MAVAVAWLVGFSLFFFTRPMPNLSGTFAETRAEAWRMVPLVVLEWILPSDAQDTGLPSGWEYFPQRLGLWMWAGLILFGAWGLGRLILHWLVPREDLTPLERFVFALGAGLSLVSLLTLGLGVVGVLHRGLFIGILIIAGLAGLGSVFWTRRKNRSPDAPSEKCPTRNGS